MKFVRLTDVPPCRVALISRHRDDRPVVLALHHHAAEIATWLAPLVIPVDGDPTVLHDADIVDLPF